MFPRVRYNHLPGDAGLFVLLATLWGTSFVAIEVGLHHVPPLAFAALRFGGAGALVLGYAVVRGRAAPRASRNGAGRRSAQWLPRTRADHLAVAVLGVFVIAGTHALLYLGERHVSGAVAAVVISLSPVLTVGFARALLGAERLTPAAAAGFVLGVAGVAVVADLDSASAAAGGVVGVGLVFLAAASFALGSVLSRPIDADLPLPATAGWAMLLGAGILVGASVLRGESVAGVAWTVPAVASLAYLTLCSGAFAYVVYFALVDRRGPTEINLVGYLEPVVATLAGWLLFGQVVALTTVAGFGAIAAGFALVKGDALQAMVAGRR